MWRRAWVLACRWDTIVFGHSDLLTFRKARWCSKRKARNWRRKNALVAHEYLTNLWADKGANTSNSSHQVHRSRQSLQLVPTQYSTERQLIRPFVAVLKTNYNAKHVPALTTSNFDDSTNALGERELILALNCSKSYLLRLSKQLMAFPSWLLGAQDSACTFQGWSVST